jgi:hypothetical protein
MFYVPVDPHWGGNLTTWVNTNPLPSGWRRMKWSNVKSPALEIMILDIYYQGIKAESTGAVERFEHIRTFANMMLETANNTTSKSFPLAGLWEDGLGVYWLAHTSEYLAHMVNVYTTPP